MATDSDVAEDAMRVAVVDETGDSHPLDRATDDHCAPDFTCAVAEVKQELLVHVKTEDAHEHIMTDPDFSVKVRHFAIPYVNAQEEHCISIMMF